MADVTLSASVRQSLLSLQNTTSLIKQTQNRLSTGLKVSSAVDNPVAFFSSKSLSDRAGDLLQKKDGIDQGVSTVTAALDGVTGIESLVSQMKGIANSLKSATASQVSDLITQFNDLRNQINYLATDASYQGTNLINGTGQTLSVEFSDQSSSLLTIASVDLRAGTAGLNVTSAQAYTGSFAVNNGAIAAAAANSGNFTGYLSTTSSFSVTFAGPTNYTYTAGETVSFTYGTGSSYNLVVGTGSALTVNNGSSYSVEVVTATDQLTTAGSFALVATGNRNLVIGYSALTGTALTSGNTINLTYNGSNTVTLTTADGALSFAFGTGTVTSVDLHVLSGQTLTLTQGAVIATKVVSTATTAATTQNAYIQLTATSVTVSSAGSTGTFNYGIAINGNATAIAANTQTARFVQAGDTTTLNAAISQLDTALTTLRTKSQSLGSNVALLNTRLDFTKNYVDTLQAGADKLTLADVNQEGANLLALQTRQQLGIQSLSLAAQSEASILRLFG